MAKKIVVPRRLAMRAWIRFYFTGKPCKHGHIAERYTLTGQCAECVRIRNQLRKIVSIRTS